MINLALGPQKKLTKKEQKAINLQNKLMKLQLKVYWKMIAQDQKFIDKQIKGQIGKIYGVSVVDNFRRIKK